MINIIQKISNKHSTFTKKTIMSNKRRKVSKDETKLDRDIDEFFFPPPCHCTVCYQFMGIDNPRQLCGKTICYNK